MSRHVVLLMSGDGATREKVHASVPPGCLLGEAASGAEGLTRVRRDSLDLVLVDALLPDMRGDEVCRSVKSLKAGVFLPVMIVGSAGEEMDRVDGFEAGADDVVPLAVGPRELALRLRRLLWLREQDRAARDARDHVARVESLLELRDELGTLLVHDITNPLSSVKALLSVLRDEVSPELRSDVEVASLATREIESLMRDLLDVNLVESGELRLERHVRSVAGICEEAVRALAGLARDRGVRVTVHQEGDPRSSVDERLLRRALENMLANAYRYSPRNGEVAVRVWARRESCLVAVADRGPGVPDAHKCVLFRKFGSVNARRGAARRGHGLGLYLVRRVAEAHGGSVSVLDRSGGGAIFRLSLPKEV